MPRPTSTPVGLALSRAARTVERAFDEALGAAGASRPVWLVLVALKSGPPETQMELAETIGIRGATLTHHLNAMERDGLITRTRRPDNRRVHDVALTDEGARLFGALVGVVQAHDRRLRRGLSERQLDDLRAVLDKFRANVTA